MEVRLRMIGNHWAYACPRCLNGTMYWEREKADNSHFLKCILCGREIKFEKTGGKDPTGRKFEAKSPADAENKHDKTDNKREKKWVFGKKVQNC